MNALFQKKTNEYVIVNKKKNKNKKNRKSKKQINKFKIQSANLIFFYIACKTKKLIKHSKSLPATLKFSIHFSDTWENVNQVVR